MTKEKQPTLKIAHISDLHFCTEDLCAALKEFRDRVSDLTAKRIDLDIHIQNDETLRALETKINELDPDVIAITGDVTTFGDSKSYEMVGEWLNKVRQRTARPERVCIAVPGNHDLFRDHFSALRINGAHSFKWWIRWPAKWAIRQALKPLNKWLNYRWNKENLLNEFYAFCSNFRIKNDELRLNLGAHSEVALISFNTVSTDPTWMNKGQSPPAEWASVRQKVVSTKNNDKGCLRIVLCHHNPIGSPQTVEEQFSYAYNGMPSGPMFMKELQTAGVDLILHGHQHVEALYSFDFHPSDQCGHAYTIGCSCSSSSEKAGFHLIEVCDINHGILTSYQLGVTKSNFIKVTESHLSFERNRPTDFSTASARYELKQFVANSDGSDSPKVYKELESPGAELIYLAGRQLSQVRAGKFKTLRDMLQSMPGANQKPKIRLLISDPELLRQIVAVTGEKWLVWGHERLDALAAEAEETIKELREFIGNLDADARSRIEVRTSHTLLPFGALSRNPNRPWGKMAVRILPIGAIKVIHSPCLQLNCRSDDALYDHYLGHLKYLLLHGKPLSGLNDWSHGDEDLHSEYSYKPISPLNGTASALINKTPSKARAKKPRPSRRKRY